MRQSGLFFLLLLTLAACQPTTALIPTPTAATVSQDIQTLNVVCPESMSPVMKSLAATYSEQHAQTLQIVVIERADSLAIQTLEIGDADMALLSWMPETSTMWSTPIAKDGLAIVVHPQNGLPGMTMNQLRQLYQGQVESWESWGGLPGVPLLISREDASGDYAFFQNHVMQETRVALTAILAPTSKAVLQLVNENQLSIAYISHIHINSTVRPLAIEGIPPTTETIELGIYPLSRNLQILTLDEPQGEIRNFIQWILEAEGQSIMAAQGLLPITQ